MGKRLLSSDYRNLVFKSFCIPESDHYNYYMNVIEENISSNSDIFQDLISALQLWIEWYNSQIGPICPSGIDETGKLVHIDPEELRLEREETLIPLANYFNVPYGYHVNKLLFDRQIKLIKTLKQSHELKIIVNQARETLKHGQQAIKELKENNKHHEGRKPKEPKSFEHLFKDTTMAKQVKNILIDSGFIKNGVWDGNCINGTTNKTSLVAVYTVLKPLFKDDYQNDKTILGRYFYKECGIENLISERSFRNNPPSTDEAIFKKLFSKILPNS